MNQSENISENYFLSNSLDDNDLVTLKTDIFNLRLRCYNLSTELNNCTCYRNKSESQENRNKLNTYLGPRYELLEEIKALKESNKILNKQVDELKSSQLKLINVDYITIKNQQLTDLINKDNADSEMMTEILKINDNLVKSNIKLKHKVLNLEVSLKNEKLRSFQNLSFNDNTYHSKLIKNFNDSLDISKTMDANCHECNALKVSYDQLNELLLKLIEKETKLSQDMKEKDVRITELDEEIESLKCQLKIENQKNSEKFIRSAMKSLLKKDVELKTAKSTLDEVTEFFNVQIGLLNSSLIGKNGDHNHLMRLHKTNARMICDIVTNLLNNRVIASTTQNALRKLEMSLSDNAILTASVVSDQWSLLTELVATVCQSALAKSDQNSLELLNINKLDQVCVERLVDGFTEMTQLTRELFESSTDFANAIGVPSTEIIEPHYHKDTHSDGYSSQYELDLVTNRPPHNKLQSKLHNNLASFVFKDISLNATAFQSFSIESDGTNQLSCSAFEQMMTKINELGDAIHRYSDIVRDFSKTDEDSKTVVSMRNTIEMLDKSCLVQGDVRELNVMEDASALNEGLVDRDEMIKLLNEELHQTKSNLEERNQHLEALNLALAEANEKYDSSTAMILSLRSKLTSSLDEQERLRLELANSNENNQSSATMIQSLRSKITLSIDEVEHLRLELADANENLQSYDLMIQSLKTELRLSSDEIRNLHIQLEEANTSADRLQCQEHRLTSQLSDIIAEKTALTDTKMHLETDLGDALASLENMSRSVTILTEEATVVCEAIRQTHARVMNSEHMEPELHILYLLEDIASHAYKQQSLNDVNVGTDPLITDSDHNPNSISLTVSSTRSSIISNKVEQGDNAMALNDLTNITSFDSEVELGASNDITDLIGFRISCLRDIVDNPSKVLRLLRFYDKTIKDLKRRLAMRYEQTKQLRDQVNAARCLEKYTPAINKIENFKNECSGNNEKVEKVIKPRTLRK